MAKCLSSAPAKDALSRWIPHLYVPTQIEGDYRQWGGLNNDVYLIVGL